MNDRRGWWNIVNKLSGRKTKNTTICLRGRIDRYRPCDYPK
jgi:hypothetical protein